MSDIRSEYEALQNGPKENHWASKNGLQMVSEQCSNISYTLTNKFFDVEIFIAKNMISTKMASGLIRPRVDFGPI